jgi:hypothetical protein
VCFHWAVGWRLDAAREQHCGRRCGAGPGGAMPAEVARVAEEREDAGEKLGQAWRCAGVVADRAARWSDVGG